jgi:hypothetical protein
MLDYRILYRRKLALTDLSTASADWTTFLSAHNDSDRVREVFEAVESEVRHWLIHPEYQFAENELPTGAIAPKAFNEAEFWAAYVRASGADLTAGTVCVDTTGFMRPHLAYLMAWLFAAGVKRFVALYTDPVHYTKQEKTQFTKGPVVDVRQVAGFEGSHVPDSSNDLVIIGTGYDDELIRRVAEHKSNARKVQLFGHPSLEPDMYQQSVIRAARAAEAVGVRGDRDVLFAPANDPFVTAQVLRERIREEDTKEPITNLYLTSLGTKPQMLGFALYYLTERQGTATSLLFPYARAYSRETTKGIARIWMYTIELLEPGTSQTAS